MGKLYLVLKGYRYALRILLLLVVVGLGGKSWGQVNMATTGSYSQNFDGLISTASNTWIDNSTILNWYAQRSVTGSTIIANDGSTNGGGLYSFGTGTSTERALGSIGSGTTKNLAWGVLLKNTSGASLTDIKVTYTGEQWRDGGNSTPAAQTVSFFYITSTSAISSLDPGSNSSWTSVPALDFISPIFTTTASALNGNAIANKVQKTNIAIPSLSLANGSYIMLKWDDPDHTGSDHGLAIDDVTISWTTSSPTPVLAITGTPTNLGTLCPGTASSSVQYTITNSGSVAAAGVTVASNDPQFVVSGLSSTSIAASGGTATYNVVFTPVSAGVKSATITAASTTSGSNSPASSLSGTGTTPVTPIVNSSAATLTVNTTATLNGTVNTLGVCPATTEKGFVYCLTATNNDPHAGDPGVTKTAVAGVATGAYNLGISGLTIGAGYSFKAYVFDGTTYTYGAVTTFSTTGTFTSNTAVGDWNVGSTWDLGSVPGPNDIAIIRSTDIVYTAASLTRNNTTTVNGSFQLNDGGFASGTNNFTYGAAGTLIFNKTSGSYYTVNNTDIFWPAVSGPFNVNVISTGAGNGLYLNTGANRTVAGTFATAGGVSLGGTLTLTGTCQINNGGYFNNSPTYGAGSTLKYYANTTYNNGLEWTPGASPANVQLSNNTILNYPAITGARAITGNLTIDNGSALYMDYLGVNSNGPLSVGGNLKLDGGLSLGNTIGDDLNVGGNWTRTGTFTPNSRLVSFNGSATGQTMTGVTTFDYLTLNNSNGLTLANNAIVNKTLALTSGKITLGTSNLTIGGTGTITGGSSSNFIITNSTGVLQRNAVGNTATDFPVGNLAGSYTPLTITNPGTANDISVGSSATIDNAVTDATKIVTLQWSVITSGAGAVVNTVFNWNVANQAASYTATGTGELGNYTAGPNYNITPIGTMAGLTKTVNGITLSSGTNKLVIGNTNAVYVVPCFSEDFASASSGDNTTTTGSPSLWGGNANFPNTNLINVYQAGGAIKIGTGSALGSITSAALNGVGGTNVAISFDVKGWTTVEGSINVTLNGVTQNVTYTAVMSGSFQTKTLNFSNVPTGATLIIATTAQRAFIDNVKLICTGTPPTIPTCSELFISEYVEGSSNNKYIEIYNPTNAAISLTNYSLRLYSNGSGSITTEDALSGSIPAYTTKVYKNISATLYIGAATTSTAVAFNGNDAFALAKNGTNIDILGSIGVDPGTEWTAIGGYSTANQTLVRKSSVQKGINVNPGSSFPTLGTEWDLYNQDDVTHLGYHTNLCNPEVTGYYRSKSAGPANWNSASSWESSVTGSNPWNPATVGPTKDAAGINIQVGHTIIVNSSITLDQTTVAGILELQDGAVLNINNGTGDDLIILGTGIMNIKNSTTYNYADIIVQAGSININNGGKIAVLGNGTSAAGQLQNFATNASNVWNTDAVFEWNCSNATPGLSGETYFPNANATTIPIFRIINQNVANALGGGTATIINGLFQIYTDLTFMGGSPKTFRNGITGNSTLTQNTTVGNSFNITGSNAILGGSALKIVLNSPLNLTTSVTVPTDSIVTISGANIANNTLGNVLTVNGTLDVTTIGITNSIVSPASNELVIVNGKYRTATTPGTATAELCSIPSGTVIVGAGSTVELYASADQLLKSRSDFANLIFSGSGTKTFTSGFNPAGKVLIKDAAIVDASSQTFGDAGTSLTMTDNSRFKMAGTGTKPDITGIYNLTGGTLPNNSVIEFYNSLGTTQTIRSDYGSSPSTDIVYNQIEVRGTNVGNSNGDITLNSSGGKFTVVGTPTITPAAIFYMSNKSIKSSAASNTSSVIVGTGARFVTNSSLGFSGSPTTTIPPNNSSIQVNIDASNITLNTGSIVDYGRAGDQSISNQIPYQNFVISGTGTKTAPSGTLEIKGNIVKTGTATFAHNNGTVLFSGASQDYGVNNTMALPVMSFYNVTNNSGNLNIKDSMSIEKQLSLPAASVLNLTSGDISLKSTAANTANVSAVAGSINYTSGRFIIERFINNSAHAKAWQFLATPIDPASTQTIKQAFQEGGSANSNPKPGYGTQLTNVSGTSAGYDAATPGPSIKTYVSGADKWDSGPSNTGNTVYNPKGWMTFVRGDRTITSSVTGVTNNTVLRTRGKLNVGNQGPFAVGANVYESVGNPYASAIDLGKTTRTNLTGQIYIWDPSLGSQGSGAYSVGRYRVLAARPIPDDNIYDVSPSGGAFISGTNSNYIQSGQAFFIKGLPTLSGSISFSETSKVSTSFLTNGITGPGGYEMLATNLSIYDNSLGKLLLDGALTYFKEGYSNDVDGDDGTKIMNAGENTGFLTNGKLLSVERRALPKATDTLNLNFSGARQQTYNWNFNATDLDKTGLTAYLWDRYTNKKSILNPNDSTSVDFTVDANAASAVADRFKIVFDVSAGPLPVTLTTVTATRNTDKTITVKWRSDNELNLQNYTVERSADGSSFSSLGVAAPTNNNGGSAVYAFNDISPLGSDNYYRIRALSKNGMQQYSSIVKVSAEKLPSGISVYPNPVVNREMYISFVNQPKGEYSLELVNKLGQVIYRGKLTVTANVEKKKVSLAFVAASGLYRLNIRAADGTVNSLDLLVNND